MSRPEFERSIQGANRFTYWTVRSLFVLFLTFGMCLLFLTTKRALNGEPDVLLAGTGAFSSGIGAVLLRVTQRERIHYQRERLIANSLMLSDELVRCDNVEKCQSLERAHKEVLAVLGTIK